MLKTTRKTTSADRFNFYFNCPKSVHEDGGHLFKERKKENGKMSLKLFQVFVPLLFLPLL